VIYSATEYIIENKELVEVIRIDKKNRENIIIVCTKTTNDESGFQVSEFLRTNIQICRRWRYISNLWILISILKD
jgi:hypothetical protein